MERYLQNQIVKDLERKMVFLGGPRQVGKTTLALSILGASSEEHPGYLNWDDSSDRKRIVEGALPTAQPLLVLDEIHKYRAWRNLVKGLYDKHKSSKRFLITGSARLDYYRRGGDSLQGRYHYLRLHPLSWGELKSSSPAELDQLLEFGGFPEPFLSADKTFWRRWQRERLKRVVYDDLISLEQVEQLSSLELLTSLLPARVGSPLSINNLATDLQVAPKTIKRWLLILENLYFCFRISPYGLPRIRAVKKEQKLYLWDWSLCEEPAARLENLVASQLLKYCHLIEDTQGFEMELRYIRDHDKREIDFVVLKQRRPLFAVECKLGAKEPSPQLRYFAERLPIPAFYQVHLGDTDNEYPAIRTQVVPFVKWSARLNLP